MLYLFFGSDREAAKAALDKALGKKTNIVRITDANSVADLQAALRGAGMFGEKKVVVLDSAFANEEMRDIILRELPHIGESEEVFYILEGKLDADTRKKIEKHAGKTEKFDAKKEKEGGEIFSLAYALKRGDKKALWVGYQRALLNDAATEAIHGILFWGAKDMHMKTKGAEQARAAKLVAELAELPHEARRSGFEFEYALEKYILSVGNTERSRSINKS